MKIEEIDKKYTDPNFKDNFIDLFSLHLYLKKCFTKKKFDFKEVGSSAISLSEEGEKLLKKLKRKLPRVEEDLLKIAIFLDFYNSNLLVDVDKCNIQALIKSVSKLVENQSIIFPWLYGRTLYNKYYSEFDSQELSLDHESVIRLLDNTPQGVFQLGRLVVGPLGILYAEEKRYIPPTQKVYLWHCADPSCNNFHTVDLVNSNEIMDNIQSKIYELTKELEDSEWYPYFRENSKTDNYYVFNNIENTFITIANTFGENEIRLILREILDNKSGARLKLPQTKKYKDSSENIVKTLSKSECFQLLLLFKSFDVLFYTEKLIYENRIYIPATEVRSSKITTSTGFWDAYQECNKLGFRSKSPHTQVSLVNLRNLILKIYSDPILGQQLDWNLRFYNQESLMEKCEEYVKRQNPAKIVREVILNGSSQLTKSFEILSGYFKIPENEIEENVLITRILWKLGFNINIYPSSIEVFNKRLSDFSRVVNERNIYLEPEKEKIRSSAVNLFVSLEDILKQSLAFSTWLLLSDHLHNTKFRYNYTDAIALMTKTLNGYKLGEDIELVYNPNGNNTLFPLIEGFTALIQICEKLIEDNDISNIREDNELPRFIGETDLINFPLKHKLLVLDLKSSSFLKIKDIIFFITTEFSKSKILATRNSLEHDRQDFPSKEQLLASCDSLPKIIEKLLEIGLFPNVYLFKSKITDEFGRNTKTFVDYSGKEISITELINFKGYPVPSIDSPIIITPQISFPNINEPLRIKFEENSEYLDYWKNYPLRKH